MANTSVIKLYKLCNDYSLDEVMEKIRNEKKFTNFSIRSDVTIPKVRIKAIVKETKNKPDWYRLFLPYYAKQRNNELKFINHNFIAFIEVKENSHCYLLTGGYSYTTIQKYVENDFGLSILERIFDEDINLVNAIDEKSIVGDVLASRRFYRNARSLEYEDDFAKFFSKINTYITIKQIETAFPSLYEKMKTRDKGITFEGSNNIVIRKKVELHSLTQVILDIDNLLEKSKPSIFNKSLIPVDKRTQEDLLQQLKQSVYKNIAQLILAISNIDFSFCNTDVFKFFQSDKLIISFGPVQDSSTERIEDFYSITPESLSKKLKNLIEMHSDTGTELNVDYVLQKVKEVRIFTYSEDGYQTTSGSLLEYLQLELVYFGKPYFLINNAFYYVKEDFDEILNRKYKKLLSKRIKNFNFILPWDDAKNETAYNEKYQEVNNAYYLHMIKPSYVEMCDILYFDHEKKETYFIHVKFGIGATIRDLVSQVIISSRMVEEEIVSSDFNYLNKVFESGRSKERFIGLSKDDYKNWLKTYTRNYCLAVYDERSGLLENGNFSSRIAKFSFIDYAMVMRGFDSFFYICPIP